MNAIVMGLVPPLAPVALPPLLVAAGVLLLPPLRPELQAASSPLPPTTAAPAPAARSTPRRLKLASTDVCAGAPAAPNPVPLSFWSLMCHLSPSIPRTVRIRIVTFYHPSPKQH